MKNRIYWLLLSFLIVSFFSCKNENGIDLKNQNSSNTSDKRRIITNSIDSTEIKYKDDFDFKINVEDIKSQIDQVTTTFVSKKDGRFFYQNEKRLFGYYTLIKNNEGGKLKRVGNMIVYDSISPYNYEEGIDEFIEITLKEKGISLFNGHLEIGLNSEKVIEKFGNNYATRNEGTILIYEHNKKKAFFKIEDNILKGIKIGVYKKDISIDELLKNMNW